MTDFTDFTQAAAELADPASRDLDPLARLDLAESLGVTERELFAIDKFLEMKDLYRIEHMSVVRLRQELDAARARAPAEKPKCTAVKRDGDPCNAYAMSGSAFCLFHEPTGARRGPGVKPPRLEAE